MENIPVSTLTVTRTGSLDVKIAILLAPLITNKILLRIYQQNVSTLWKPATGSRISIIFLKILLKHLLTCSAWCFL